MFNRKSHYSQKNMTAKPSKYPQGNFKTKDCRWCCEEFEPQAPSHLYCSDLCKDKSRTDQYYMKNYGVGLHELEMMLEEQDHLCAICHREGFKMHDSVFMNLNLDHNHKTKEVRGLLCHNCNRALGLFQDDTTVLTRAISYLQGATTISKESTYKCTEAHSSES
jgi:hypothetical protein